MPVPFVAQSEYDFKFWVVDSVDWEALISESGCTEVGPSSNPCCLGTEPCLGTTDAGNAYFSLHALYE
jgi:hypothetical protein